jgi:hypothetical protein
MKYLIVCYFLLMLIPSGHITEDCTCNKTKLYGRVRFVEDAGDFRIRFVSHNPDLKITFVTRPANKCGEWQIVEGGEDFTVCVVEGGEDFTIRYNESNPGIN